MGPVRGVVRHTRSIFVKRVQTTILCSSVQGPGRNADSLFRMVVNTVNPTASGIS